MDQVYVLALPRAAVAITNEFSPHCSEFGRNARGGSTVPDHDGTFFVERSKGHMMPTPIPEQRAQTIEDALLC